MSPSSADRLGVWGRWSTIPPRLVFTLAMACLVTCCTSTRWDPQPVEASESAIRFDHPDFDPELAEYALGRDPMSGDELHVARFSGADAFAMLVVLRTGPNHVVPDGTLESDIGRSMDGADLTWGESGQVPSRMGYVPFRMFRLADQPFRCVGFGHRFGETGDDMRRKRNLVIGWLCHDKSRPVSTTAAADLIAKVSVGR